jgi:hypothetical protein
VWATRRTNNALAAAVVVVVVACSSISDQIRQIQRGKITALTNYQDGTIMIIILSVMLEVQKGGFKKEQNDWITSPNNIPPTQHHRCRKQGFYPTSNCF